MRYFPLLLSDEIITCGSWEICLSETIGSSVGPAREPLDRDQDRIVELLSQPQYSWDKLCEAVHVRAGRGRVRMLEIWNRNIRPGQRPYLICTFGDCRLVYIRGLSVNDQRFQIAVTWQFLSVPETCRRASSGYTSGR